MRKNAQTDKELSVNKQFYTGHNMMSHHSREELHNYSMKVVILQWVSGYSFNTIYKKLLKLVPFIIFFFWFPYYLQAHNFYFYCSLLNRVMQKAIKFSNYHYTMKNSF